MDDETKILARNPAGEPHKRNACIVNIYSPGQTLGTRYALEDAPVVIGRDKACDISVDDVSVSRRHARLDPSGDGYALVDLQSANGTYVNDARVSTQQLKDGDCIRIGNAIFRFLGGGNIEAEYEPGPPDPSLQTIPTRLGELVARHGPELCADVRRCKSMILDLCGDKTREANLLIQALEQQVPADLLAMAKDRAISPPLTLERLQKRLQDRVGSAETLARWSVHCWAIALAEFPKSDGAPPHASPWARIEQIPRPRASYTRPPMPTCTPNPWPKGLPRTIPPRPARPAILDSPPAPPAALEVPPALPRPPVRPTVLDVPTAMPAELSLPPKLPPPPVRPTPPPEPPTIVVPKVPHRRMEPEGDQKVVGALAAVCGVLFPIGLGMGFAYSAVSGNRGAERALPPVAAKHYHV